VTIVNVALPTIRGDLGASATQLEWVVSAYMLAFAAALITAGSLGDLLGRKRLFLTGIALFGAASLAAGLAQAPGELIAARVAQGAAAAVMTPQLLATFRTIFSAKERGQAFGLYGAVLGFASAIGLILGGILTSANLFGWSVPRCRWCSPRPRSPTTTVSARSRPGHSGDGRAAQRGASGRGHWHPAGSR
jgi:MFS family permease